MEAPTPNDILAKAQETLDAVNGYYEAMTKDEVLTIAQRANRATRAANIITACHHALDSADSLMRIEALDAETAAEDSDI